LYASKSQKYKQQLSNDPASKLILYNAKLEYYQLLKDRESNGSQSGGVLTPGKYLILFQNNSDSTKAFSAILDKQVAGMTTTLNSKIIESALSETNPGYKLSFKTPNATKITDQNVVVSLLSKKPTQYVKEVFVNSANWDGPVKDIANKVVEKLKKAPNNTVVPTHYFVIEINLFGSNKLLEKGTLSVDNAASTVVPTSDVDTNQTGRTISNILNYIRY